MIECVCIFAVFFSKEIDSCGLLLSRALLIWMAGKINLYSSYEILEKGML